MDLVDSLYMTLESTCRSYLSEEAWQHVLQAYHFAKAAHAGQFRKSGEPFITHPLTVAIYMARAYVDEVTLISALLHDVAEDTDCTLEDIETRFGPQTRQLVAGVTHLKNVSQLEDIAHFFVALITDVRVVLIKLYDRLHNMQTLEFMSPENQRRKAFETLRVYVPLAAKFGIWRLKTELETLVLRYIDPEAFLSITQTIDQNRREHLSRLQQVEQDLQSLLRGYDILCSTTIEQRSPYRIYESTREQRFEDASFRRILRVVVQVDDIARCYLALGYIHKHYAHMANLLADYVGNPKDIFYRSLHTTILVPRYSPVDVRVRTYEADRLAQLGIITQLQFAQSHEHKTPPEASFLPEMRELVGEIADANKFVETVFQDILKKHIVCFTPRGRDISLPRGATVLDFAYRVHTDIGHECRGAVVNGKHVEVPYKLADGDHVEVIRSRRTEPQLEWLDEILNYTTTSHARRKIREWLRRQKSSALVKQGRDVLQHVRRTYNVMHVTAPTLAEEMGLDNVQQLYQNIGNGTITLSELILKLLSHVPDLLVECEREYVEVQDHLGQRGRLVTMEGREIRLANCCRPMVGDAIVSFINGRQDEPIKVHRQRCPFVLRSPRPEHFIQMDWVYATQPLYNVYVRAEGYDRGGLLRDMSIPIAEVGANIARVETHDIRGGIALQLKLELTTSQQLIRIIHHLETLQNITFVQRLNHHEVQNRRGGAGHATMAAGD
ncbi:MAG: bifunctional (p)ppGpp synthetase/guanosine-3',5'-bis(diphosphate) 3'-pyrophosphohydrolase [Anaerolineae bacterium]|nr:bifunctional (p)ppGpp synthetase/guanosine-3',5'-bis(diphosphate) 3'-pyrophosphohydrolase [Anaerolineae bacterium]